MNTLNVVPIRQVHDELVDGYQDVWASKLTELKRELESGAVREAADPEIAQDD